MWCASSAGQARAHVCGNSRHAFAAIHFPATHICSAAQDVQGPWIPKGRHEYDQKDWSVEQGLQTAAKASDAGSLGMGNCACPMSTVEALIIPSQLLPAQTDKVQDTGAHVAICSIENLRL